MALRRYLSLLVVFLLVVNLALFASGRTSVEVFWGAVALGLAFVYLVLPRL